MTDWHKNRMREEEHKNQGRMVEAIHPSYVIFHLSALDFEHKEEENARGFCVRNKNQRELYFKQIVR